MVLVLSCFHYNFQMCAQLTFTILVQKKSTGTSGDVPLNWGLLLSEEDVIAIEVKYHPNCLRALTQSDSPLPRKRVQISCIA